MEEKKKVPNPWGRKGCPEHQSLIKQIAKMIAKRGFLADTEHKVEKNNGAKKDRYADIAAIDKKTEKAVEYHQVGKNNKDGETPIKRERDASEDIEKSTGIKVIFHKYTKLILIALLLSALYYLFKNPVL